MLCILSCDIHISKNLGAHGFDADLGAVRVDLDGAVPIGAKRFCVGMKELAFDFEMGKLIEVF